MDPRQSALKFSGNLYRLAFSYCRNREDAEDVVQDVFVKLLRSDLCFPDEEHLKSWLLKVTVNTCKDLLRSPWRWRCCSLEAVESVVLMKEESALLSAVLGLPVKYRGVVHLYYYEGHSVSQIAATLGISESAVRMRLLRARQKLKDELGGIWNDG